MSSKSLAPPENGCTGDDAQLVGGFGVFECFVEGLAGMGSVHDAPAVIVTAETCGGFVVTVAGVGGRADFV